MGEVPDGAIGAILSEWKEHENLVRRAAGGIILVAGKEVNCAKVCQNLDGPQTDCETVGPFGCNLKHRPEMHNPIFGVDRV